MWDFGHGWVKSSLWGVRGYFRTRFKPGRTRLLPYSHFFIRRFPSIINLPYVERVEGVESGKSSC